MPENVLTVEARSETGKGVCRRLRAAGRIPAVVYGRGRDTRAISVNPAALAALLQASGAGFNTLIDLEIEGASEKVLLKALQRDPVGGAFVHADFHQIDLSRKVVISVPLHFSGRAKGVEFEGGILDHPVREVEIECLPTSIPEAIEVDVSALGLNEALHISELTLPEGAELRSNAELAVAIVAPPRVEEQPAEEEAAEGEAPAEGDEASDETKPGEPAGEGDGAGAEKKSSGD